MNGEVVVGGNGRGNGLHQLNRSTDVLIDKESDSLIICEYGNPRVVRWFRRSGTTQGEILIDSIHCRGLAMDDQRYLYASDVEKDEVRRYQLGEKNGTLVTGGNGLSQLKERRHLFVDQQQNVYVSDERNHRVMKWTKGAKEGIVVAGGQGRRNALTQLWTPTGLFVDTLGTLYVADSNNHRVMHWTQGAKQDTVIVGGNGQGAGANQFNSLDGLSFDRHASLLELGTLGLPIALIYRGPATCHGCSETIADRLRSKYQIIYVGPKEQLDVNKDTLSMAQLYVQPGGGDLDETWPHVRRYASPLRDYVRNGGRYLGTCLGAYLAGTLPGFDLLPGKGQTDQYITSKGAVITSEIDTVVPLYWRGILRHVYFQDGTRLMIDRTAAPAEILAVYTNGEIAAAVQNNGKGRVGMVGPHPEADENDMNYENTFRYLLIICFIIHAINGQTKTITKENVFVEHFSNNKKYAIDDCIPLAFGDFNADKIVDIFCRNTKANSIVVMLNDDRSPTSKVQYIANITGIIYDALAADFDGDSKLDLFIIYKTESDESFYSGGFLWGDRIKLSDLQPIPYSFQTIPTTLDANGDSYVELLGMISNDQINFKPACLTFKNRTVYNVETLNNVDDLFPSSTQATVDLNHDLVADLFLTINHNNKPKFRLYELPITKMTLIVEYDPPDDVAICHLSTFADIDADGELEHILPVCMNFDCSDSRIYVRDNNKWYKLPIDFGKDLRFPSKNEFPPPFDQIPISIKVADYNLDGFPDMVAVMKNSSNGNTVSIILQNRACSDANSGNCTYNRTFAPQIDEIYVLAGTNTTLAVFFDVLEDGYPDLLVLQGSSKQNFKLIGFQNSLFQDVHFIKVMVLSTFSCDTCSHQRKLVGKFLSEAIIASTKFLFQPYGNDQPGQSIKMETITILDGIKDNWIQLSAVQMSQSGQLTLELPYVIIGLGATPNFVEKITVAIPPNSQSNQLIRTYTQMIPNSQIVVVPSPLTNPEKWHSKLFITPSRMILHTGIALSVTLVVLSGVLAILQYREKIEDDRERKVQSQRFHYDAL
ncbi:unnamed protein product [Rotaria magnacalcarata]|uniref:Uncharacterized protein n=5 Tax=Rotaria magnacalcarata TaxID=392030 RepID=A0A819KY85_9BILA|nr:unnamed protein product [Rotaria magnacalcarata]